MLRRREGPYVDPAVFIDDPYLPVIHYRCRIHESVGEWYRWGAEFAAYLKLLAGLRRGSRVLEIGCNVGRNTQALRDAIGAEGLYRGFDIDRDGIEYLSELYREAHPNFQFVHADLHNALYNPTGTLRADTYRFPYADAAFDIVFAASIFTHMAPPTTAHYFRETARVLAPGGYFVPTFFVADYYGGRGSTAYGADFEFEHPFPGHGDVCRTVRLENPEFLTAYRLEAIHRYAHEAGLVEAREHFRGRWSQRHADPLSDQEIFVFRKPEAG